MPPVPSKVNRRIGNADRRKNDRRVKPAWRSKAGRNRFDVNLFLDEFKALAEPRPKKFAEHKNLAQPKFTVFSFTDRRKLSDLRKNKGRRKTDQ